MSVRHIIHFIAALFIVLPFAAHAQSSSATVVPDAASPDVVPPVPAKPLIVPDTNYPLESLLANEEGRVTLKLAIDKQGRVTSVKRAAPSGSARLDAGAILVARTQWQFQPATQNNQPVDGTVNVAVDWKMPLRSADDLYSDMMGFPTSGHKITPPVRLPITVTSADYPILSRQRNEQGEVALRISVSETGAVSDVKVVDSSSFSRLDEAAVAFATNRLRFQPGTVDGTPRAISVYFLLTFVMGERGYRPPIFCHSRPIIGQSVGMSAGGAESPLNVEEWVHTSGTAVDDVVVVTSNGWKRFSEPLVKAVAAELGPALAPPAARPQAATGSLIAPAIRRPASCWYQVPVAGRSAN